MKTCRGCLTIHQSRIMLSQFDYKKKKWASKQNEVTLGEGYLPTDQLVFFESPKKGLQPTESSRIGCSGILLITVQLCIAAAAKKVGLKLNGFGDCSRTLCSANWLNNFRVFFQRCQMLLECDARLRDDCEGLRKVTRSSSASADKKIWPPNRR